MSTTPDYGEPWRVVSLADGGIASSDGSPIIDKLGQSHRAISCVNTCAGMADPAAEIEAMRVVVKGIRFVAYQPAEVREALAKLKPFIKP